MQKIVSIHFVLYFAISEQDHEKLEDDILSSSRLSHSVSLGSNDIIQQMDLCRVCNL